MFSHGNSICRGFVVMALAAIILLGVRSFGTAQDQPPENPQPAVPGSASDAEGPAQNRPLEEEQQEPNTASAGEVEVLGQGPIHEAFAEPLSQSVTKPIIVDRAPPEPIEELPPQHRPAGENVQWIPGYWFWLEDRNDFVWVSGVWRTVPPGRQWTPGHWTTDPQGYRWVSGFWSDVEAEQIEYLPYPPDSVEAGPNSPAPGKNRLWIPGCWRWEGHRYVWRPGYWYAGHADWVWVPHHYVYTPRGAVFVSGYWDYPLQQRGLLYAPVYWRGGYRPGLVYTPSSLVNTALLLTALFVDGDRGYYYYGPGFYDRRGYYPWFTGYGTGIYSPFFGFYAARYGYDSDRWRDRYDWRRHRDRAAQQSRLVGSLDDLRRTARQDAELVDGGTLAQVTELTQADREAVRQRMRNMQQFRAARAKFESEGGNEALQAQRQQRPSRQRQGGDAQEAPRTASNVPDDYRPPKFDLRTAEGAQELRQQARKRHEVMRLNVDGDPRAQQQDRSIKNRNLENSANDARSRNPARNAEAQRRAIDRAGRDARTAAGPTNRPEEVRGNRQPPPPPRTPQLRPRRESQPRAVRGQESRPPQVNRGPGNQGNRNRGK